MASLARVTIDKVVALDYDSVSRLIEDFIKNLVDSAGAGGVVVGVSGGVDSATTLALSVRALGRERVYALIMPDSTVTPQADVEDARGLVESLGVKWSQIDIAPIVDVYKSSLPIYGGDEDDRVPLGNLRARIRMSLLYYYANKLGYLVMGTGDRSEILIGYYTKYGDGAADAFPIGVLYKSQVRRLAVKLGVPERIAFKPSSPRLWPGHEAEKELGLRYDEVDVVLHAVFDLGIPWEEASKATGVEEDKVEAIKRRYEATRHKREPPPMPSIEEVRRLYRA